MPISDKENYNEYMRKYQMDRYNTRRAEFIAYLGGFCVRCGTSEGLEFDHIDRSKKSFNISKVLVRMNYDKLREEVDKCQLLCTDCHIEKSREAKDLGNVDHGGGATGKRNCKCEPCKAKKAEYMKAKKPQYNAARNAKRSEKEQA
jgi:hypothetical protein